MTNATGSNSHFKPVVMDLLKKEYGFIQKQVLNELILPNRAVKLQV